MASTSVELRCDICTFRDGHKALKMIQCTECQLAVHKECYGMDLYTKRTFVCWACAAVGKSFQVESRQEDGKCLMITQSERPTKCDLCCVGGGNHAMHPIYDNSGTGGRQLFQLTPNPRLVWAHSLCAFFLSTQGFLFGCARNGSYHEGDDDASADDEHDDNRSINPESERESPEEINDYEGNVVPIHHFVYYIKREGKKPSDFVNGVRLQKTSLKCTLCGADDSSDSIYRIPIQCVAGDDHEPVEFQTQHYSLDPGVPCCVGMHVGCARWGGDNKHRVKRVYYFPGNDTLDAINGVYCNLHAEEVDIPFRRKRAAHAAANKDQQSAKRARLSSNTASVRAVAPSVRSKSTKLLPADLSVLPSLAKMPQSKKQKRRASAKDQKAKAQPEGTQPGGSSNKKVSKHHNLDKELAVAVSNIERPTLLNSRKALASKKSVVTDSAVDRVFYDLSSRMVGRVHEPEDRTRIIKERKKFWKRELSELETNDFKELWQKARGMLVDSIMEDEENTKFPATIDLTTDDEEIAKPVATERKPSPGAIEAGLSLEAKKRGNPSSSVPAGSSAKHKDKLKSGKGRRLEAPGATGRKGKRAKKVDGKPRHGLSAYNLFYAAQKDVITKEILEEIEAKERASEIKAEGESEEVIAETEAAKATEDQEAQGEVKTQQAQENQGERSAISNVSNRTLAATRDEGAHRKTRGKIDLATLTRIVAVRWNALSLEKRRPYQDLADEDRERQKKTTADYEKKNAAEEDPSLSLTSPANKPREVSPPPAVEKQAGLRSSTVDETALSSDSDSESGRAWDDLFIGPYFRNEPYKFGEWDAIKML